MPIKSSTSHSIILFIIAAMLLVLSCAAQDEGGQKLSNETVGAYQLSVWVSPEPPTVGRLHIIARLREKGGGAITTTPEVAITAHAPHTDVFELAIVRMNDSYAADIDIPYAATWNIEIGIDEGGEKAKTSFPLEVNPAPMDKNLIRLAAFATLVVLLTGWWFWGRHPRKKRVRKRIFMPRPDEKE